jgi:hypothetical protein
MRRGTSLLLGIMLSCVTGLDAAELRFPEIAGWNQSGGSQTFSPKTLYEYINGAADLYLASDFEELRVAEYRDEKKASVVVEAYRHRTSRDAFGIYSQERLPSPNILKVGAQGYIDSNILNFVQGRYYVKISSFNTGAADREVLQAVAKKVAEDLGEKGGLPSLLSAFPAEGKKGNSEKYLTRNFLGYSFFNSVYTADYERAGKTFRLFLIEAADRNEGKEIVERYLRQVGDPARAVNEGRHTVADPHHGVVDLFWKGAYIWGAVDLADGDLRSQYLKSFEGNVKPGR